jgi:hypothetical protein
MKKLILSLIVTGATAFSLIIMTSLGCGSPDEVGGGGKSGGGNAGSPVFNLDASAVIRGGAGGSAGPAPTGDANCGSQTNSTTQQPADVLLVLDRSGSMNNDIAEECRCAGSSSGSDPCPDQNACKDRWTTVSAALETTLAATPDINWGLKLYSTTGNGCDVNDGVEVQVAANTASAIMSQIQRTKPNGNTPTAAAITKATAYLKTLTDPNNKVILLATDGQPNCKPGASRTSESDVDGTLDAIKAAYAAGFFVYVIGIGPSVGNLDNFAVAGGTTKHYPATSPDQLAAALASISVAVASCTFSLNTVPPDVNNVAVYLDKALVPQNAANGWSFGASSQVIVLNGSTCDRIKASTGSIVQVLFGCPGTAPPQFIP